MNRDYKKGALLSAISGIFSLGICAYFTMLFINKKQGVFLLDSTATQDVPVGNIANVQGIYRFTIIAITLSILLIVVFSFLKLEKVSMGLLVCIYSFASIHYIKYMEGYYSEAMKSLFDDKVNKKLNLTVYLIDVSFSPYLVFILAMLCLVMFILCLTTPNRAGVASIINVLVVLKAILSVSGMIAIISYYSKYASRIQNFQINSILSIIEAITSMLMVLGITTSVKLEDPKRVNNNRITPNNGMYGIPYAELPHQNSQFGFGSANNNVYNTPRNPYYDQRGSFNQMGGFGQQAMMNGFNQNTNYNQPQNMGNYGGGFGQPMMGGFNQNMQFGGFNQNMQVGGFNPNMNYNQPQNTADFGSFTPNPNFSQPQMNNFSQQAQNNSQLNKNDSTKSDRVEEKKAEPITPVEKSDAELPADKPAEKPDISIYEKPDNSISFDQPQSFTSTDI